MAHCIANTNDDYLYRNMAARETAVLQVAPRSRPDQPNIDCTTRSKGSSTPTSSSVMGLPSIPHSSVTSPASSFTSEHIEPVPSAPEPCTSAQCPVSRPHYGGVYRYYYEEPLPGSVVASRLFEPSIPPPNVARALERCLQNAASTKDQDDVATFHGLHTEPLIDSNILRWAAPHPFVVDDKSSDVIVKSKPRHPFGFTNPPESVWQAFTRVSANEASDMDVEMVGTFSSERSYVGFGVGSGAVISTKRWTVRLPGRYHHK